MHVLLWILTGLAAGWVVGVTHGDRRFGLLGDLSIGALGAAIGGSLFRALGVTAPYATFANFGVALGGALACILALRIAWHLARRTAHVAGAALGKENLDARLARLSELERRVLGKFLRRQAAVQDPNAAFDAVLTPGQRAADRLAQFGGSWAFISLFTALLIAWIAFNREWPRPFDPYPFILLNLVLSCLAAVQAPIILMSQNRQAQKDRLDARLDYEVNLKAEMEILALHEKLDMLREKAWSELVAVQERQLALLDRIERALGRGATPPA